MTAMDLYLNSTSWVSRAYQKWCGRG